jgi:2-hydroxy-4-carboxymuconate semialdehyde hemiacetal dehydrogenase
MFYIIGTSHFTPRSTIMKICVAGEGAQGLTHLEALQSIENVEVQSLAGGIAADAETFATEWNIAHWSLDFSECIGQNDIEAVILCSPNQVHCQQAIAAMEAGKHVLIEIPMGLNLEESRRIVAAEQRTGKVCMVCHTQRYSNVFREVHRRITAGELTPYHIVQQTYFFRRKNENRFGKPRTWVDDLLWHQACHMVDMTYWLLGDLEAQAWGQAGAMHPELAIPMDISIAMRSQNGALVTAAQSFNHHGSIWSHYRIIGEETTLTIEKNKLYDHEGNELAVEGGGGVGAQDREFFSAIREGRKALTSCSACLPVMEALDRIQQTLDT